ncbi:MAG: branched-chain amino acid ABC transporter substrate-binding protein [Alphaproteobacteria bacterium]|nr:branched-chain amino acid ABC transporter substrate-binding protein [Alphaproteobacteria bacterium]
MCDFLITSYDPWIGNPANHLTTVWRLMPVFKRLFVLLMSLVLMAGSAAAEDIVVAVAGPMTGKFKELGNQMRAGAELAVDEINRAGGVNGRKLQLVVADDRCDRVQSVVVAKELATKKVAMVAGHLCSRASIAAAATYAKAGIIMISPGSTHPQLTDIARRSGWRNVFRVCGRDDDQGVVVAQLLATRYRGKRVAILHDKSQYGLGLARQVQRSARKLGLREAVFQSYKPDQSNISALVERLKSAKIDAVFLGGYFPEGAAIIRQAHERAFAPQFVTGDAFVTDEFWRTTGKAGEGTLMTFHADPRGRPEAKAALQAAKNGNKTLGFYGIYTYAAIEVWSVAARSAKSSRAANVSQSLRAGRHQTVVGLLQFDKKGDVRGPRYVWYVWKGGKYLPQQ